MSSVSVDFACVGSWWCGAPIRRGADDRGEGTMMPFAGEEAAALPLACQGEEPPFWTVGLQLPPPPPPCSQTFKGLPAQNSCSECIMEMAPLQSTESCVSCSQTPPVNSSIVLWVEGGLVEGNFNFLFLFYFWDFDGLIFTQRQTATV